MPLTNIVSHSMGAKFAQGVIEVLNENKIEVDIAISIAGFQDWTIDYGSTNTMQFVNKGDIPSGNSLRIKTTGN